MKIAKSLCIVIIIITIISCKKSSNTTSPSPTTYGYFFLNNSYERDYSGSSSPMFMNGYASVYVLNVPTSIANNPSNYCHLGGVSLNGVNFLLNGSVNGGAFYSSGTVTNLNPPVWKITGSGDVSSFTFTDTDAMPGYTGINLLPDTIKRSQNLVLQINGISNFEGGVFLDIIGADSIPNSTPSDIHIPINNPTTNNTITIPSYSLSSLVPSYTSSNTTYNGNIELTITSKTTLHILGSSVCSFTYSSSFSDFVYIK